MKEESCCSGPGIHRETQPAAAQPECARMLPEGLLVSFLLLLLAMPRDAVSGHCWLFSLAVLRRRNGALEHCLAFAGLVLRGQAGQLQKWKFSCSGKLRGKGGADFFAVGRRIVFGLLLVFFLA